MAASTRSLFALVALALCALPAGCVAAGDSEGDDAIASDDDADLEVDEAELKTSGGYKNKAYNWGGQSHNSVCVKLDDGAVHLRNADGSATGLLLTNEMLTPYPVREEIGGGLYRSTDGAVTCAPGYARLDARETIDSPQGKLLFHRGGWGFVGGDEWAAARFGHIRASDLAKSVKPEASSASKHGTNGTQGNGDACKKFTSAKYRVVVESIPQDMWYLSSNPAKGPVTSYTIYGNAGGDLGTPDQRAMGLEFSLLAWSWINVSGGGVARAVVKNNQNFRRCAGVPAIKLASVDKNTSAPNGWVTAVYGGTRVNDETIYGWLVHSHRHGNGAVKYHLRRVD